MANVPVVEKHTREFLATSFAGGIGAWRSYPTPKRYEESKPSKCEDTTIHIDRIQPGD